MIYITGDCHSDFRKFSADIFPEQKEMTKRDYMIICGDFGGIWYQEGSGHMREEKYWLDWLEEKPFTTLFVDGNHENFQRLYSFPVEEWNGGRVHKIRPSVMHLMRGEIFVLENKKIFAFGGASSHDIADGILTMDEKGNWRRIAKQWNKQHKMYRVRDLSWWEQELPTQEEMNHGLDILNKNHYEVDYIVSHCCPRQTEILFSDGLYKPDILTRYFDVVAEKTKFQKWFFGHYHDNRQIMRDYILLYEQIIRIA